MTRFTLPTRLLFPIFLLIITTAAAALEERSCTIHDQDGNFYDLNPLSANTDYEFTSPGGHRFVLNVCRPIHGETWNLRVDDPADVAGFIRRDHGDFSIGKANTTLVKEKGDNVKLVMEDGSQCTSKSGAKQEYKASTVISFICDTKVFGAGTPTLVAQLPHNDEEACAWFIEWNTHYACPRGERGGPWGFFTLLAVLLLILLALYTTLGTLYNRYVLNLRGFDQLPQFSIEGIRYHTAEVFDFAKDSLRDGGWREIVEKIKEGAIAGVALLIGFVTRSDHRGGTSAAARGQGYYGRVPSGPEERAESGFHRPTPNRRPAPPPAPSGGAPNSFSHQAGVDIGSGRGTPNSNNAPAAKGGIGEINPVSHFSQSQAQVQAQGQQQQPQPPPPPSVNNANDFHQPMTDQDQGQEMTTPVKKKNMGDVKSTKEERTFLIEDEDDDGEDIVLQDNTTPQPTPAPQEQTPTSAPPSHSADAHSGGNETARMRGRDLSEEGGEGTIRL
ncbi:mannose 6-phosphate receptor domain-containing protein [Dendrothele bispora CBS 962.96]|uniref:Autophagy-related protein 27 n=1 Tax=Dendrothele bispora (strain CBS 962.96) TaxID=1314807 RepID=A0A4S8M3K8_DENBC|nr:mannose 6-phosphate receptor domain-containing protein [Dendrothele bispora CBS 962.96]